MQRVFEFCRALPERPERPERLFFGVLPDAETSARLERFRDVFVGRIEGRWLKTACLHVSLHHVGDYRRLRTKFIYAATEAARRVEMRPFGLSFHAIKTFDTGPPTDGKPRKRPLVLLCESDGLAELHERLACAMVKIGLQARPRSTPHMTLAYASHSVPVRAIAPICLVVTDFALIHSALGCTRHDVVERWPLGRRAA